MSVQTITEDKVHTERRGNTRITIIKYTDHYYDVGAITYTAYLEHDSAEMQSSFGNFNADYETEGYDTKREALANARAEADTMNSRLDKYWIW